MTPEELEKMLEEILILLVNNSEIKRGILKKYGMDYSILDMLENNTICGITIETEKLKYIVLNHECCDNLVYNLMHEKVHYSNPTIEPKFPEPETGLVDIIAQRYWDTKEYRKIFQNKIVELCGRWNL